MKVAIAGARGQIAMQLARALQDRRDEVIGLVRRPDQADDLRANGAEPVVCDLESADEDELAEAIRHADAVVFTAGAGPGSGAERKETVDYGGAVKLIAAAKKADVPRYVMVSAMSADPEREGDEVYDVYARAKGRADAELEESGLEYTIVRPGRLTDDPPTGQVKLDKSVKAGEVTRGDVAEVLAAVLHAPGTIGKTLELTNAGRKSVDEAVSSV